MGKLKKPLKRGRKPATAAERAAWRNVYFSMRCTEEEARTVRRKALAAGESVSAYLRRLGVAG